MLRKATGIAGAIAAGTLLTIALADLVLSPQPAEVAANTAGQARTSHRRMLRTLVLIAPG